MIRIPGIGDWTAHYIAMRAMGEPDAFPAGDLGIIKALQNGDKRPTVKQYGKEPINGVHGGPMRPCTSGIAKGAGMMFYDYFETGLIGTSDPCGRRRRAPAHCLSKGERLHRYTRRLEEGAGFLHR